VVLENFTLFYLLFSRLWCWKNLLFNLLFSRLWCWKNLLLNLLFSRLFCWKILNFALLFSHLWCWKIYFLICCSAACGSGLVSPGDRKCGASQRSSSQHNMRDTTPGTLLHFYSSVADPDPGSGIGFSYPGSRIPDSQTHIFESLVTIFWV
jgi:hypothetical protein